MKLKKKSKKPPLSVIPFKEEEGSYSGSDKHEKLQSIVTKVSRCEHKFKVTIT
jgi:hypothetical protein